MLKPYPCNFSVTPSSRWGMSPIRHAEHDYSKTAEAAKRRTPPNGPRSCSCIGISRYDHRSCATCHALRKGRERLYRLTSAGDPGVRQPSLPQEKLVASTPSQQQDGPLLKKQDAASVHGCGICLFNAIRASCFCFLLPAPCPYPRNAICSVTICVRSGFTNPCSRALNSSTLLDQFMLQNFGPHILQNAASL